MSQTKPVYAKIIKNTERSHTQYQQVPQSQYSTIFAMQLPKISFHKEDNTCQSMSNLLDFIFALLKEKKKKDL